MSNGLGKLFQQNKQTTVVSKYLKETSVETVDGIESAGHLSESIERREQLVPPVDYSDPANFVKFGSAEQYYNDSMNYIADYYPYDGPASEKVKFYNELNPLEKYILDEQYPGSTGFVLFNPTWGTVTDTDSGYSIASATPSEYIQVKGGPHSGTIYSTPSNRTSNLEFGGPSGSTIEFFYKKNEGMPASSTQGQKQVILDVWNGHLSASEGYGRLRVEVFSGSEDRFHVTMLSGTRGYFTQSVPTTGNINICSGSWNHYAFVFNTDTKIPTLDFYIDGNCWETNIAPVGHQAGEIGLVTGSLVGNIGSLRSAISGALEGTAETELTYQGYGKLSASVDEFRFWKSNRNPQEIGRYWFTHVNGGSNKFDENKDLGVYFKFNEGITGNPNIDKVALDYSGRISNGTFVSYDESYSRNLGSAINTLQLTNVSESLDPIIRKENPAFLSKRGELGLTGSTYDYENSSRLLDQVPAWIIQEDENSGGEIKSLLQIMSNYFDTAYVQVEYLTKLKNVDYISGSLTGSIKEFPHVDRLLDNVGLETPEIFENISALAQFDQRDEKIKFDQALNNTKNLIYRNIYNNLSFIYKAKGTSKSIRNFIRCLGVGEDVIALNTYANNAEYYLTSSYRTISSPKKYVDFSGLSNAQSNQSTVYQYYDSTNPASYGIINGSGSSTDLEEFAFTVEGEFVFPNRDHIDNLDFVAYTPVTSSLFGYHTPQYPTPTSTDLTWIGSNSDWGLQVYAVKSPGEYATIYSPLDKVRDVYFAVENRAGDTILTSSIFPEAYTNQKWNLALSVRPKKWPYAEGVLGTSFAGGSALEYELELYGAQYDGDIKRASFSEKLDLTYLTGSSMVNSAKRIYAGAHRTNFNGTLLEYGDTRASSIRYWSDYIPNETIDLHARESFSFGRKNPYRNVYSFQTAKPNVYIPEIQTLAMNWDFANLSASNGSGQLLVSDFSSGSVHAGYISDYQDGADSTFSDINLRQHTGRGDLFPADFTVVKKQYVHTGKLQPVDYSLSDDMIRILDSDDEYFTINYRPQNLFFAVEKSLYRSISERMLQLFASIDEFNNLMGEPVNKYRPTYKNLEKLREIFFRNVQGAPDFEKYVKFYKWLDVSMGEMIQQLMPASVAKAENVRTIIENHSLERPKINYKYPGSYKTRMPEADGTIRNLGKVCPDEPGWKFTHAPINELQNTNCNWWQTRALRNNEHLNISTENQASATAILTAVQQDISSSTIVCFNADLNFPVIGGINQSINKRRNIKDVVYSSFESLEDCTDELAPNLKTKIAFKAVKDGTGYRGELLAPFTTISSSNNLGGYQSTLLKGGLSGINIVDLHEDVIHPFDNSVPMQTPFTQQHVGGFQARHVAPMSYLPSGSVCRYRQESHILNVAGGEIEILRIITGSIPKGHYLRDHASKSPLNIQNIKTFTGSLAGNAGVNIIGNYKLGYQVLQSADRDAANMDFIFNTGSYYTGSIPSAFITPLTMRSQSVPYHEELVVGRTGSADYTNPRQRDNRRTNKNIFVSRFAAPGSKLDSRQQFRDVELDQLSPNNALPFRNIPVRQTYNTNLKIYTGWGGFVSSSGTDQLNEYGGTVLTALNEGVPFTDPDDASVTVIPATASIHKTQRNTTHRIKTLGSELTPGAGLTLGTGSVRDSWFVTRPIPEADRTAWFMSLSGTNEPGNEMMHQFLLSSSHYPKNITITTSSLLTEAINSFGTASLFSNSSGQTSHLWSTENVDFVPWSQLRQGDTTRGSYFWRNNLFEIPATTPQLTVTERIAATSANKSLGFYRTRMTVDRGGNQVPYRYYNRYREAPITSRYKPILHHIKTHPGTAERTNYHSPINVTVKYSYGNYLMGFANRPLNNKYAKNLKWNTNKIKRPYESFRDNHVTDLPATVDGTDIIRLTSYAETIYPQEVYTYLSASRGRLAFYNNFWKNDKRVATVNIASTPISTLALLNDDNNIQAYNRQYPRISSSFVTSQDFLLLRSGQISYDEIASPAPTGPGSGSIWPMDSYFYAESTASLKGVTDGAGYRFLLAGASTLPCGELMLTSHGQVRANSSAQTSEYLRGDAVSAQYIYSAPAMVRLTKTTYKGVKPASPGGAYSRPAWVANISRRVVEGPQRGVLLEGRSPFYNSYEDYASDVRAKGQEFTIVPEYRMSENLATYELNGNAFQLVADTLALTGASHTLNSSLNSLFFDRFVNTDEMEYLNPFMQKETLDFSFNKYPRHFEIKSDAVLKLLPYDGFYPAQRSLGLATLFSSSHSYNFRGVSGSSRQAMRAMLRPYFAPGLLFNSIKSGIAVDYPIRRKDRNEDQFIPVPADGILSGALSGALSSPVAGEIPNNNRRFNGNNPATVGQNSFDFSLTNVNKFLWGDRLPFEALMTPENYLASSKHITVLSDINEVLYNDVSGSLKETSPLYRKAMSNFLAAVPEFFLTKKTNLNGSDGYLTKFVSRFGKSSNLPDQSAPNSGQTPAGQVYASSDTAYIMEIGLTKTDKFNLYNNPYAFGIPTATGSGDWNGSDSGSLGESGAQRPSGSNWPTHRGEFAPFTPPYYYGTSVARITFAPKDSRNYTLNEIIGWAAENTTIEFLNESGSYYDFDIGSYIDLNGDSRSTTSTPPYGWNRAWQNRMDIDASICLTNVFPLENGITIPADPNKWVIMPKWECPILDFPNWSSPTEDTRYNFSSSVDLGEFDYQVGTYGMWHQYGIMPQKNEGVFMYIKDVSLKETELRLIGDPDNSASPTGQQIEVRKVPKWVIESGRSAGSLADLVGFDPNEVMRGNFQAEKAKRLGVLGETNEKVISEAVLAMPFYIDAKNKPRFMTLKASPTELGPKIKEFRRVFTKYSLPPALASRLSTLIPSTYPQIPSFINPFGGDDLDSTLSGVPLITTPVVYLLEHGVNLSRQDLSDIWQGILPDIGNSLTLDVAAIDHYMPGEKVENDTLKFPEIIQKQIELNIPRTGHPRVDLLDISELPSRDGFNTEIKWFVFKVKRRGLKSYSKLISKEINGYDYDPYQSAIDAMEPLLRGRMSPERIQALRSIMAIVSYSDNNAVDDPTYNWPYDYFSLVELDKLTTKVGFRPDLAKENAELDQIQQARLDERQQPVDGPPGADFDNLGANSRALQDLLNNQNDGNS